MARRPIISDAQRLRDMASAAENMADLAVVTDDTLARARRDVLSLAAAARKLADQLTLLAGNGGGT